MKCLLMPLLLLLMGAAGHADGILIPELPFEPLSIRYHRVQVTIDDQAAHTSIDQVFHNPTPMDLEGTYLFPIPAQASFSAFSMHVDGEPLTAEILPADEARRIYEEIVRQRIDPALLEYVGRGAYRARIFPIPAEGDRRIELAYDEVLRRDDGIVRYVYPLNTEKFSAEPLEDVSVQVTIRSTAPIRSVYSPSHDIIVDRTSDHMVLVTYADEGVLPTQDFTLYYTVSPDPVGIDILTHFPPDEEEGYYLLLAAPQADPVTDHVIPKRMIYVIDRSGSMAGEKMEQARAALRFAVNSMRPEDSFNIVDYGTTVESLDDSAAPVTAQTRARALDYIEGLTATGGTNIEGALLAAMSMLGTEDGAAQMLVFLTDGRPTIGQTDIDRLVADVTGANTTSVRLFAFGVGHEVNTHLLDRLAGDNGGTSSYVTPGEDIEVAVSSFYSKVSSPVLTDLTLEFQGANTLDVYPQSLPDLFRGSQVVQAGRMTLEGPASVRLSGTIVGDRVDFERDVAVGNGETAAFLPRLWATRKVGFLLDQIRLNGEDQELVDEIVALSRRYGIITPYTSFLIVEDEPTVPIADNPSLSSESGADAVRAAEDVADYAGASNTEKTRSEAVRYAGGKTFYWRDGGWRDSEFDDDRPALRLAFGSESYFDLVRRRPDLGPYLAVGTKVLLRVGGEQYEIADTATIIESAPSLPAQSWLEPNFPNPFNPETTIRFRLDEAASVTLTIFDVAGRRVRTLVEQRRHLASAYDVVWNGRDEAGERVASGVYVIRLRAGTGLQTRKMLLMK
jgi:Ca-activated chloride channel homolog